MQSKVYRKPFQIGEHKQALCLSFCEAFFLYRNQLISVHF